MARADRGGRARPARPKKEEGRPEGASGAAAEWIRSLLVAVVIFLVLRSFIVQTFVITSGSMEETLLVGDFLVVNRAAIGSRVPFTGLRIPGYSRARLNDVIVFDPPHERDMKLVKRLVGMPGDLLEMRERVLYRNGQAVDEPYLKHLPVPDEPHAWMAWQTAHVAPGVDPATYQPTRDNWGPLVIPEDRYFMLGDNRESSLDSRYWGLLEGYRLEGRAVFIYFSYNRDSFRPFAFLREVRWGRVGDLIR
jgi:signal peptidase I